MYRKNGENEFKSSLSLHKVGLEMELWENFDFLWCTHKNICNVLIFYKHVLDWRKVWNYEKQWKNLGKEVRTNGSVSPTRETSEGDVGLPRATVNSGPDWVQSTQPQVMAPHRGEGSGWACSRESVPGGVGPITGLHLSKAEPQWA